jgi:hypothetical protein
MSELLTYTESSIVALHGLEGGSESTWSCGTVNWLRDQNMLQHALPHARIMSYGYDASIETYTNQANFRDQTQKFLDRLLHERDDVRCSNTYYVRNMVIEHCTGLEGSKTYYLHWTQSRRYCDKNGMFIV